MGLLTSKRAASLLAAGASVLALGAMSDSASAACTNITGQGATFQAAAQNIWAGNFGCIGNVVYTGTGSGAGLNAWGATSGASPSGDEYIGTDDAPTAAQIANIRRAAGNADLQIFPVVQASVAVLANLPANCSATNAPASLRADARALQDVYDGDTAIDFNDLFPGQLTGAGCSGDVRPYARSGGSGTTQIFKQYLNLISGWTGNTTGDNVWPAAAGVSITATSGSSISALVDANDGTVGYAVLPDALNRGLSNVPDGNGFWVLLENALDDDTWHDPETATGKLSNCSGTVYSNVPRSTVNADWSNTFGVSVSGVGNYPICGFSYVIAYDQDYTTTPSVTGRVFTADQNDTVGRYLVHVTTTGQTLLGGNNYAPLPTGAVLSLAQAAAASVGR